MPDAATNALFEQLLAEDRRRRREDALRRALFPHPVRCQRPRRVVSLTPRDAEVLWLVARQEGVRARELAAALDCHKTTVSRSTRTLRQAGLVRDARAGGLVATAKGRSELMAIARRAQSLQGNPGGVRRGPELRRT